MKGLKSAYPEIDGPLPGPRGVFPLLGLEPRVALEHDGVRFEEPGHEPGSKTLEADVGHWNTEQVTR